MKKVPNKKLRLLPENALHIIKMYQAKAPFGQNEERLQPLMTVPQIIMTHTGLKLAEYIMNTPLLTELEIHLKTIISL